MHILLIEPDRLQAAVYKRVFTDLGDTVAHSTSAQFAIQLADEQRPDVVVMEVQMPKHNGVEFLYEFRSYPDWLKVPIVVHTFVPEHELSQTATLYSELGVYKLLYKPATSLATLCTSVRGAAAAVI